MGPKRMVSGIAVVVLAVFFRCASETMDAQKPRIGGPAVTWTQVYDPTGHWWLSTLIAALPIIVLLGLLGGRRVRPHLCAIPGASTAAIVPILAFKIPALVTI